MSRLMFAVVTTAPDAFGFGVAQFGDASRRFYCDPTRFAGAFAPPEVGERIAVYHDIMTVGREWVAVWKIRGGTPTYQWGG